MARLRGEISVRWPRHGYRRTTRQTFRTNLWRPLSCVPGDFSSKRHPRRKARAGKEATRWNPEDETRQAGCRLGRVRRSAGLRCACVRRDRRLEGISVYPCTYRTGCRYGRVARCSGSCLAILQKPAVTLRPPGTRVLF